MPLPADGSKLKLGKGSLLLDQLLAGVSQGFDFAGNCSAIAVAAEVTQVEKYSSTQQAAPLIGRARTRLSYTLTATLDEFGLAMLRKFLLAEEADKQQPLNASASLEIDDVVLGRYYQLGARQVSAVSVTDGSDPLVAGTDYSINTEFGLIRPLVGGALAEGGTLAVEWSQAAITIKQLRIAKSASSICHLLYLADDANADGDGAQDRLEIWRADVAPNGELGLISEEFGTYQLSIGVLDDSANHPDDPFGTYDRIAA